MLLNFKSVLCPPKCLYSRGGSSGRASDSAARGPGFDPHDHREVSQGHF